MSDYLIQLQERNHFEHFEMWLKKLFYLNDCLQKEFDSIYQDAFYVKIYELLNDGISYASEMIELHEKAQNLKSKVWYEKFLLSIQQLNSQFSKDELDFIEYKRNESCHIFLRGYDRLKKDFSENKTRKNQNLLIIQSNIYKVIKKLEQFENGHLHINRKIHPILNELYSQLK